MDWKEMIPKCFGCVDKVYAMHPVEKQHAKKMISAAKKSGATKDEVADALREHLEQTDKGNDHIEEQLKSFTKATARQEW